MTTLLSAQILINSVDVTSHLVSMERNCTLEKPGCTVALEFDSGLNFSAINPWHDLVTYENGTKVLTGYVTHIIPSRSSAGPTVAIQGMDTFKRCSDWFIGDNLYTGGPDAILSTDLTTHTLNYYVGYLCNLCGISYSINDTAGSSYNMISDVQLGLQSVSDTLTMLCGIIQWQMRVDANGILQFDHINKPTSPDYTLNTVIGFEEDVNDTDTKNQVKVWGLQSITSGSAGALGVGGEVLYQEDRPVVGVNGTRTMVYAIPQIDTTAKAKDLAKAALDQWAMLEDVGAFQIVGNPAIRVGQSVGYNNSFMTSRSYLDTVTDLRSTMNGAGYKQELTAGRRSYRFPFWSTRTSGSTAPNPVIWETSGSGTNIGYVQKIFYDSGYLYLTGQETTVSAGNLNRHMKIEKRDATNGNLIWQNQIVGSSTTLGSGIFIDSADSSKLYVGNLEFSTFLVQNFSDIYTLNSTTGSILSLKQLAQTSGNVIATPRMSQDIAYVYITKGTDGSEKVLKAGMVNQFVTAASVPTDIATDPGSTGYIYELERSHLNKEKKSDGTVLETIAITASSSSGPYAMSYKGGKAYVLYITSASSGSWEVRRYSTGAADHTPITLDWSITGPNNYFKLGFTTQPEELGIYAGDTILSIGLSYLYTAYLSLSDGSLLFEDQSSADSNDCFSTCIEANGVYYAGGRRNSQWFVQARQIT
jgi:hypothetical protein